MAQTEKIIEIIVSSEHNGERLDKFLTLLLPDVSRSKVQKLILNEKVKIKGEVCGKAGTIVTTSDLIHIDMSQNEVFHEKTHISLTPRAAQFEILYEGENLIVINKPAGLVVHPGAGTYEPTLVEGVMHHLEKEGDELDFDELDNRPGVVHRLDKDTTGVMVLAKDEFTHRHLAEQFKEKSNLREYVALLNGKLNPTNIEYESYLFRDPRNRLRFSSIQPLEYEKMISEKGEQSGYRYAKSRFQLKKIYNGHYSLVTVRLFTGRTHQIRVHAKYLGASVLGDRLYGGVGHMPKGLSSEAIKEITAISRQLLHARVLGFEHPRSGKKMGFEASIPPEFRKIIEILEGL